MSKNFKKDKRDLLFIVNRLCTLFVRFNDVQKIDE